MQTQEFTTLENVLGLSGSDKKIPSLFITRIFPAANGVTSDRLLRSYIKILYKRMLLDFGVYPKIVCGVCSCMNKFFFCVFYPEKDNLQISNVKSSDYLYLPTQENNEDGFLVVFRATNNGVSSVVDFVKTGTKDKFSRLVWFKKQTGGQKVTTKTESQFIRTLFIKNSFLETVYVSYNDNVDIHTF